MKKENEIHQIIALTSHFHSDKLRDGNFGLGLFEAIDLVIATSKKFYKKYEKQLKNPKTDWETVAEDYDPDCCCYDDLLAEWTRNEINTKLEHGQLT